MASKAISYLGLNYTYHVIIICGGANCSGFELATAIIIDSGHNQLINDCSVHSHEHPLSVLTHASSLPPSRPPPVGRLSALPAPQHCQPATSTLLSGTCA